MSLYIRGSRHVLLFLLLIPAALRSQESRDDPTLSTIVVHDAGVVWGDAGKILFAPLHFDSQEWLVTSSVIGGTALLFSVDEPIRSLAQRNQSQIGDHLSEIGRQYGGTINAVAFSGGLYLAGLAMRKEEVRLTGLMTFESILFAGSITSVIKALSGRSRPFNGEGAFKYYGPQFNDDYYSLPSGHVMVAFAVSSVLASKIRNTHASAGLYALASLTAFSRVYEDEHWVSDSFLGAAIGTATALAVIHLHDDRQDGVSLSVAPTLSGLSAKLSF